MTSVFNKEKSASQPGKTAPAPGRRTYRTAAVTFALTVLCAGGALATLAIGDPFLGLRGILAALDPASLNHAAVAELRLPRAVLGLITGASLAVLGVLLQDSLRNPLAGPELTGAAPGAAFGLALSTVLLADAPTVAHTAVILGCAAVSGALVVAVSATIRDPLSIAVVGALVAALISALTVAVISLASSTAVGAALHGDARLHRRAHLGRRDSGNHRRDVDRT